MEQLFVTLLLTSKHIFNWLRQYWMDFGILISLLTAVALGVAQVLDDSNKNPYGRECWSDHDRVMLTILGTGVVFGWGFPLIFILLYWFAVCVLPITVGYGLAKVYKNIKGKVKIPKAIVEKET